MARLNVASAAVLLLSPIKVMACAEVDAPGTIVEQPNRDLFQSSAVDAGDKEIIFLPKGGADILRGRTIIDGDPTVSENKLSDGSGLQFHRDCRGLRCVYLGLKTVPDATCWSLYGQDRNAANEFVVSQSDDVEITIAYVNSKEGGQLVRRTKHPQRQGLLNVIEEPLIRKSSQIVGFSISVPALHMPWRSLHVFTKGENGSIALSTYALSTLPPAAAFILSPEPQP